MQFQFPICLNADHLGAKPPPNAPREKVDLDESLKIQGGTHPQENVIDEPLQEYSSRVPPPLNLCTLFSLIHATPLPWKKEDHKHMSGSDVITFRLCGKKKGENYWT